MVDNRAGGDSVDNRGRSLLKCIQDPDQIVTVLGFVSLIDGKAFEHKQWQQVADPHFNPFLNSSVVEQLAAVTDCLLPKIHPLTFRRIRI